MTPIFLVSLPRSGSTLAQRVIAAHPKVATTAEPWLLLPLYSILEKNLCKTRYGQKWLYQAVDDLCNALPEGRIHYHEAVRSFANSLYGVIAAEKNAQFFLDKTPRYHLIIHHILEGFQNGKIIILWRNPLAVLASQIKSYGGVWRYQHFQVDLFDGLTNLVKVCESDSERILTFRFEDMISNPASTFKRIFNFIGITYNHQYLNEFSQISMRGRMGDKTGVRDYHTISSEPIHKWKQTLASPLRKVWSRRYLNWIGEERLRIMGYDRQELLNQLDSVSISWNTFSSDLIRLIHGKFVLWRYGGMF